MSVSDNLWFRRSVISAAAVLLIGLATVSALRFAGANGRSQPTGHDLTDLQASDFEMPEIPDDLNAAAWLQAGAAAIVRTNEEKEAVAPATFLPYEEWTDELRGEVRDALDRHRGALETMHMAANLERSSYRIRYSDGVRARIPDLLTLLDADRLLMLEARVALADGERQRTLDALATMTRLATSLDEESTLITALVGIACERMQLTAAAEVVASDQPWVADGEVLDRLEATISTADGAELIGRVFDAWSAVMELHVNGLATGSEAEYGDIERTLADVDRTMVAATRSVLLGRLETPYGRDPESLDAADPTTLFDPRRGDVFTDMEGFAKAIGRLQSVEAQRQLVRAAIAMRRDLLDSGTYSPTRPAGVVELAAPDPFTGRRILYQPQPDGSLVLALDGAKELLERTILASAAATVVPIHLPAP